MEVTAMGEPLQPPGLQADFELRDNAAVVRFTGEVDLSNSDKFGAWLDDGLTAAAQLLVIDLNAITFFCSHGMSELMRCDAAAASKGVTVKLSNSNHPVDVLLRTTAVDEILQVYPSIEDALRSAGGPAPSGGN
jgi:anti-anti-sigma factor